MCIRDRSDVVHVHTLNVPVFVIFLLIIALEWHESENGAHHGLSLEVDAISIASLSAEAVTAFGVVLASGLGVCV